MASRIKSSPDSPRLAMGEESPGEVCWLDLRALVPALRLTLLGSLTIAALPYSLASGTTTLLLRVWPKYEDTRHTILHIIPFRTAKNRLKDFFKVAESSG